jgi:hypothetical protein
MKQLYSSGPLPGRSTPASGGPQVKAGQQLPAFKAASRGLRPEEVQTALTNTGYALPPNWTADGAGQLPVRLALLQTGSSGRMLAHVSPNGGTYFAHALLNVPATADAQMAIKTWGSPRWQRHDVDGTAELPELPYLPVADFLDDETLRTWLAESAHRSMLEFVISALLVTTVETRIVVAAPAEDVARIVYAVTRVLPHNLIEEFTFSTYESNPQSPSIRLIGHDTGTSGNDLPGACYDRGSVAFNLVSGRKSDLRSEVPFSAFAVEAVANGDTKLLDELQTTWQLLGLTDARHFDLVYRLSHGSPMLTKEEAAAAVSHPTLAAWISAHPGTLSKYVSWALEDADFAHRALSRLIPPARKKGDVISRLATEVEKAGLSAVLSGDRARTTNALEVILPMASPARANAVWGDVLAEVRDPNSLTWEMRQHLLPRLVRFKHQSGPVAGVDSALAGWLDVPAEHLHDLFTLDLPKPYLLESARRTLGRAGEPTAIFARAVSSHPDVVLHLLRDETSGDRAAALLGILLTEAPDKHWFDDVLAAGETFSAGARNRLFEVALSAGTIDPDHVIRTQGKALLNLFAGGSGLDQLCRMFLKNPPADILTDRTVLDFLGKLNDEPNAGQDVKDRISSVQVVRQFLDKPDFSADALSPVVSAVTDLSAILPASCRVQMLEAVSGEINQRATSASLQQDLELALHHLGPVLAENPAALYRELLRRQRARGDSRNSHRIEHAFLAIALGAVHNQDGAKELEGLEAEAFAIATATARRRGRRGIAEIETVSKNWPKSARTQWGFLVEAIRPKEIGRSFREMCLFAAGAGAATAVWFVVAYFTR